jgi:hypothetical protein
MVLASQSNLLALFLAVLILSGCKNPFINSILGPKANKDEEDFGGAPAAVLNVGSTGDWTGVAATINGSGNDRNYVINVTGDFGTSTTLNNTLATGLRVSIRGNHTITNTSTTRLIYVQPDQTYILRSPLKGNGSTFPLVTVVGELIMREGASISGQASSGSYGGGLTCTGIFTMYGGTISGNYGNSGGGAYIGVPGIFTMYGGTISGNDSSGSGGGVYISGGTFNMYGGKISGNSSVNYGGGVSKSGGTFNKIGGFIYGNDAGENSNRAATGTGHAAYNWSGPVYFDHTLGPLASGFVRW